MNKRTMLLMVLAFAFASAACQPPAQQMASGALSDEDLAAIGEASQTVVQAYLASDWTAVVAVLTEDAVWMPPNQPAREGRTDIQEWLSPLTVTDFELTALETEGRGDFAARSRPATFPRQPKSSATLPSPCPRASTPSPTMDGRVPKTGRLYLPYSRRSVLQLGSGVYAMRVRVRLTLRHGGLVLTASLKFQGK